jgi:hypothetical protein
MREAKFFEVQAFNEGVYEAHRILLTHVLVKGFWEQGELVSIDPFDVVHR